MRNSRLVDNGESRAVQTTELDTSRLHVDGDAAFIFIQLPVTHSCMRWWDIQRVIRSQFTSMHRVLHVIVGYCLSIAGWSLWMILDNWNLLWACALDATAIRIPKRRRECALFDLSQYLMVVWGPVLFSNGSVQLLYWTHPLLIATSSLVHFETSFILLSSMANCHWAA